jgi:uncharacterized protein YndB with AHSA1/START domain
MSTTTTPTDLATQVYRVYIKASAEEIWTAITDPEWTNRYGYTGYTHYDLRPGGALTVVPNEEFKAQHLEFAGTPCADPVITGEVIEADPPHRLKTTWRMLMAPDIATEPESTITYDIKELDGFCRLTLTHEAPNSPLTASLVSGSFEDEGNGGGGGHAWVLSDLKSLLETGSLLAG